MFRFVCHHMHPAGITWLFRVYNSRLIFSHSVHTSNNLGFAISVKIRNSIAKFFWIYICFADVVRNAQQKSIIVSYAKYISVTNLVIERIFKSIQRIDVIKVSNCISYLFAFTINESNIKFFRKHCADIIGISESKRVIELF